MKTRAALVSVSVLAGCGTKTVPVSNTDLAAVRQPPRRTEFLRRIFDALSAHDSADLMKLGEPEAEWRATLECAPPISSELDRQRARFAWVVEKMKGMRLELAQVREDTVLADIPSGYDAGAGCRTKVAMTYHRLVLALKVATQSGETRDGTWTIQVVEHEGGWYLTPDVARLVLQR